MTVIDLLHDLQSKGATLEIRGDRLRARGPKNVITPELADTLRRNKRLLMAALSGRRVTLVEYRKILNEAVTGADLPPIPPYRLGDLEHAAAWAAWWNTVELQRAHRRTVK